MTQGLPVCVACGNIVHGEPWCEVIGWERHREQGGTNHVALRKRTGRLMCVVCMDRQQHGLSPGQTTLV